MGNVNGVSDVDDGVFGETKSSTKSGVFGRNDSTADATAPAGSGVFGLTMAPDGVGVFGANNSPTKGRGVQGNGPEAGVGGFSDAGTGVLAQSNKGNAIVASTGAHDHNAVLAINNGDGQSTPTTGSPAGIGVFGVTMVPGAAGVFGANNTEVAGATGRGVQGNGPEAGVGGFSQKGAGVLAQTGAGIALHAQGGTGLAGVFDGNVQINGNVTIASGGDITFADFSEEFDIMVTADAGPGTVMILDQCGALQPSQQAYDKKVAGVISGAGNYKPGLILDKKESSGGRMPVALIGKVYCKVDAQYAPIEVGDLLTTSPTTGHAMKVGDPFKALGSVIGKALRPLETGQGLIPILIALQ